MFYVIEQFNENEIYFYLDSYEFKIKEEAFSKIEEILNEGRVATIEYKEE